MMNPAQQDALRLLDSYTHGRFDIYMLAGDANVNARRAIMSTLNGYKPNHNRVPRAKAGIAAIRQAFYAIGNITGTCLNDQENNFIEWARLQTLVK